MLLAIAIVGLLIMFSPALRLQMGIKEHYGVDRRSHAERRATERRMNDRREN